MDCWGSFWIGVGVGVSSVPVLLALCLAVGALIMRREP